MNAKVIGQGVTPRRDGGVNVRVKLDAGAEVLAAVPGLETTVDFYPGRRVQVDDGRITEAA